MNSKLYRLVFSRSRGALVAAAENVASSGKSAAGESRGAARSGVGAGGGTARYALTGLALAAGSSFGQALPTGASVQQGAAQVSTSGAAMVVNQTTPRLVTDWQSFSIGAGHSVRFVQPSSASVALNRVVGNQASAIFGSLSANGHVYLQNPAGVLFAPGAQVNVGALVATTLQADLHAFRAGELRLSGGEASTGAVVNQGSISTPAGGHVVLAGPQVGNAGSISTPLGTTALAAGNAVNVDPTGSGLLSISIPVAAIGAHLSNTGNITADGGLVALQAAATDAALRSVMQVGGVVRARSIEQRDGQIVLSGGASGVVAVTGTLDASGAAGADTRGGSVQVLGERVALLGHARIDASGDLGGGNVNVGGNFQGNGPLQNALDTHVGGAATIDASARRDGDGGQVVVWSDRTTTFAGNIAATGGSERGNGGDAEVSGKQSLRFGGGVNLRAPRGLMGTLLLDPSTITVGFVADVNGNGTTGDDIDSVGNLFYSDFGGSNSRITATQVANLLFNAQVTLQASFDINITAPITVATGGAQSTLTLNAPSVRVNAALDLNNTWLSIDTQQSGSDSVRINAPIQTNNVATIYSSDIGISSSIAANTIYLVGSGGSSVINATGALLANYVDVQRGSESSSTVNLTGSNVIGNLYLDATNANVRIVQPFFNGNGFRLGPVTVDNNFTLNVSGISVYQQDPDPPTPQPSVAVRVGGQFTLNLLDPRGELPEVFLQNGKNSFGSVVFNVPWDMFIDGSGGPLSIRGTAGRDITILNSTDVVALTGSLTSTNDFSPGNIDILGVGFDNSIGAQLVVQPGGNFTITSKDYTRDVLGPIAFGGGSGEISYVVFADYTGIVPTGGNYFYTNQSGSLIAPQSDLPAVSRVYNGGTGFGIGYAGDAATGTFSDNLQETALRIVNDGPGGYTAFGSGNFADKNVGVNKGYTTNPITNTELFGSSGASYLGLVIGSYVRPAGQSTINPVSEVTPKIVQVTGVTGINKVYDGTTTASTTGLTVNGLLPTDSVGVTSGGGLTATYADKNVGFGKTITLTGYTLVGSDAFNYSLLQATGVTANITPASLAVTGVGALDKVYDTTTVATLTGTGSLAPLGSDVVTLGGSASGAFTNKNVGANKPVSVSGFTLGGADAGNYLIQQPSGVLANITPASLSISGLSAADKAYDATTVATLVGTAVATPLGGDSVNLSGTGTGSFASKNVGVAKPVTVTGYTLGGADAGNYLLGAPPGLTADITAINLAVTGITALDKTYDATTLAQLSGSATVTPIGSDVVSAVGSGTGNFNSKNVGTAKPVTVGGYVLTGADAANYLIVQPTGATASIVPASLTVSGITAADKVYDTTTVATLTGTAVAEPLGSDAVSITGGTGTASFVDKNVGAGKLVTVTGYTLSGTDAGNYTLGQPTGLTASITPASLAIGGYAVADKIYDGTTFAALTGSPTVTPLPGDFVTIGRVGTGAFTDKNVGVGKSVTVSGFTLAGNDAFNYEVAEASPSTASITPRALTVSGLTALDKVYDATTVAQLSGTATLSNAIVGDALALSGSNLGAFADKNVGTAKPVTLSSYTLVGSDAGNYTLTQPAGLSASITPYTLVLNGVVAADKVYDTTTVATLSGTPTLTPFSGDVVSYTGGITGTFADKNVGLDKPITLTAAAALTGPDAGNYRLVAPTGSLTADITARLLTPTGIAAVPRGATSSTEVTLDTTAAALSGVLAGDTVALVTSGATGAVNSPDAGTNKTVAVSGLALSGPDARNYALSVGPNGLPNNSVPLLLGITVTLFSPLRQVFEDLRDKEYLQAVSDAQEPFRRAMTEALAAGFGKENIRKQLQRGLVFETGPAAPAVDTIAPARKPASCSAARDPNASPLSCNP